MKLNFKNIGGFLFLAAAILFFVLHIRLGQVGFISDSEIWSINIAKHISTEWLNSWVFTRPIFYSILSIVVSPLSAPIEIFEAAKITFIFNSVVLILFTGFISKEMASAGWKLFAAAASVTLLLTNTGFLNQGYRIRSDLLASSFLLASVYVTLRIWPQKWIQQIPLWVSPILATPKAILLILPFFAFPQSKRQKLVVGLSILFAAGIIIFVYPQLLNYLTETVSSGSLGGAYLSRSSFYFVERLIEKNLLFFLLFALRFMTLYLRNYFQLFESESQKQRQLFFTYFTAGIVFTLILAPEKNPFFLAAGLPIVSIFTSFLFEDFHKIIALHVGPNSKRGFQALALACSFVTAIALSGSGWRAWNEYMDQNNKFELYSSIQFVEQYLNKYPKARHYDVVGLVPARTTIMKFAGPNESEGNYWTMHELKKNPPHLIFYVRKGALLEPELSRFLKEHYMPLGGGVYGKWNYFSGWTPLTKKSWGEIENAIDLGFREVGVELNSQKEFFVLLKGSSKPTFVQKTNLSNLKNLVAKGRTSILAVSVFEAPQKNPSLLFTVGFDWNQ